MMNCRLVYYIELLVLLLFCSTSCDIKKIYISSKIESEKYFNVLRISKNEMDFGVSNEKPEDSDFYVNSNFFNKERNAIGLVVINKLRYSNRRAGGGFFYVVNNKPYISNYCPPMTEFASQSILWAIKNGIKNEELFDKSHAKKNVYRSLLGQNSEGDVIVVSSNRIGFVTIKEIIEFSEKIGVNNALLLDGGTSVDYKFTDSDDEITFQSIPNTIKKAMKIGQPTTYIYGNYK